MKVGKNVTFNTDGGAANIIDLPKQKVLKIKKNKKSILADTLIFLLYIIGIFITTLVLKSSLSAIVSFLIAIAIFIVVAPTFLIINKINKEEKVK